MKLQSDSYSCGIYAVMNAARTYGITLTRRQIAEFSNTSIRGTNEKGILNALKNTSMRGKIFNAAATEALEKLNTALKNNKPVIIYLDKEEHWCTVIGKLGKKFIIFDSDNEKQNRLEHGIQILERRQLLKRWIRNGKYYGIIVTKKIIRKENVVRQ